MFEEPKPLPEGTIIHSFLPDPAAIWVVAYAGPCGDDQCNLEHARIYLIPMIGWLSVDIPVEDDPESITSSVRPAIMTAGGLVMDYLDVPDGYKLIAVLRASNDVVSIVREIYHQKFKDEPPLISETVATVN